MQRATMGHALVDALKDDPDALTALRELLRDGAGEEGLLKPAAAARLLDLTPQTLTKAAREGRVPGAVKVGPALKLWRFRPDVLELLPPRHAIGSPGAGQARPAAVKSGTVRAIIDQARAA